MKDQISEYLTKVTDYYDRMNAIILKHVGATYQSCLLKDEFNDQDTYRATNIYCATQAGIQPRHYILDAGCGVCGPSIDIAQAFEGVRIEAITLSSAQADTAKYLIKQANLSNQIQTHIGDFHHLPFSDKTFDIVLFLESIGYSYNLLHLLKEVYRVLKPGGIIYIKEPFSKEPPLSKEEQKEIEAVNDIYIYHVTPMSLIADLLEKAGFQSISCRNLSNSFSIKMYGQAMVEYKYGFPFLTDFGKHHFYPFQIFPLFLGDIKAYK
ncbi:class I SAM-dependent methyltransferase [Chroococcus sp. FPU101]|uniref:class I SAM-dependent methyltransferase n=1 Tax=Chroococcus sp. FPU101 TaxID=1974212 RepID=UPI001A8E0E4B|nr:class I SAM-dependent methyltransferase [Chroococcus sp. FPU101]